MKKYWQLFFVVCLLLIAAASPSLAYTYEDAIDSMHKWEGGIQFDGPNYMFHYYHNIVAIDESGDGFTPVPGVKVRAERGGSLSYQDTKWTDDMGLCTLAPMKSSRDEHVLKVTEVPPGYALPQGEIRLGFEGHLLQEPTPVMISSPDWASLKGIDHVFWIEIRLKKLKTGVRFYTDETTTPSLHPKLIDSETGKVYELGGRLDRTRGKVYYTTMYGEVVPAGKYYLEDYGQGSSRAVIKFDQNGSSTVVDRKQTDGKGFFYMGRFVPEDRPSGWDEETLNGLISAYPNGLPDSFDSFGNYDHYFKLATSANQITAEVRWMDNDDKDNIRLAPGTVYFELLKKSGDEWIPAASQEREAANRKESGGVGIGTLTFDAEPDPNAEYRVRVAGYTRSEKNPNTIIFHEEKEIIYRESYQDSSDKPTVTLTAMKTFSAEKKWDIDIEDLDRPDSVTVILQKGTLDKDEIIKWSGPVDTTELKEEDDWKGTLFGERYAYTGTPEIAVVWLGYENQFRIREAKIAELRGVLKNHIDSLEDEALSKLPLPGWMKEWAKGNVLPSGKKVENDAYNWVYDHANEISGPLGDLLKDYLKDDVPENGGYITLSVPERVSVVTAKTISEHDTTYQVKYSEKDGVTTITNLAVQDVTMWKIWVDSNEEERPDSVYLMLASRINEDYQELAGEMDIPLVTQYTPVLRPIDGDMIEILGIKLPIAIGKATGPEKEEGGSDGEPAAQSDDDDGGEEKKPDWMVHFVVRKYGETGIPLDFKGSELVSGLIGEVAEAFFGKYGAILEYIAGNPFQGFFSLSTKAIEVPEMVSTIASFAGHDELKGLQSLIFNFKFSSDDSDGTHTIGGIKYWKGDIDRGNVRPKAVYIQIYEKDGSGGKGEHIGTATASADTYWTWKYTGSNIDNKNKTYIIEETADEAGNEKTIEGYETKIDGYDITNTYTGKVTKNVKIRVVKEWEKENDQTELPESVRITLFRDGEKRDEAILNESNKWTHTFSGQPYSDEQGHLYTYEVKEQAGDTYTLLSTSNSKSETKRTVTYKITLKNKVFAKTEEKKTTLTVKKSWKNDDEQSRPDKLRIYLEADGAIAAQYDLNAGEDWSHKFTDLPVKKNGKDVQYTVSEETPKNYTSKIGAVTKDWDGLHCDITNTLKTDEKIIRVKKEWEDEGHEDARPEYLDTIRLRRDGAYVKEVLLTKEKNWVSQDITMPAADWNGKPYRYTIVEAPTPSGYQFRMRMSGSGDILTLTGTNTYIDTQKNVRLNIWKIWEEGDNVQRQHKPVSVVIYANSTPCGTVELSGGPSELWRIQKVVPRYDDEGKEINYTFKEANVEDGYTSSITTSKDTSEALITYNCKVTNTRKTVKTLELKLPVKKKVTGSNDSSLWANEVFSFELTPDNNAPAPAKSVLSVTGAGSAEYAISFDNPGEYAYTLREIQGTNEAFEYDSVSRRISVSVKEENGQLSAEWKADGATVSEVVFENTVHENKTLKQDISFEKKVLGPERNNGDEKADFTFTLTPTGGAPAPQKGTVTIHDAGTANFTETGSFTVAFSKEGTYTYKLKETAADNDNYTFDETEYTITFKTKRNADGSLTATRTVTANGKAANALVFENVFHKPGEVTVVLPVEKKVNGPARDESEKAEFTFTLTPTNGTSTDIKISDAGKGSFTLVFSTDGIYTYKLKETAANKDNYTLDETEYNIAIDVKNQNGKLTATWTANGKAANALVFENTFHKPDSVTVVLPVEKRIQGAARENNEKRDFTFSLTPRNGAPAPQKGTEIKIRDAGKDDFTLVFSAEGTYTYELKELTGTAADSLNYTYDKTRYNIIVDVKKEGDKLTASWTANGEAANALVFTNVFHRPESVTVVLPVEKKINGPDREKAEQEIFSFLLTDTDNGSSISSDVLDEDTTNFALEFNTPGKYVYTLTEIAGNDPYYTYDETTYSIAIHVVEDQTTGKLTASWTANGKTVDKLVFENIFYRANPGSATVILPVEKKVYGPARTDAEKEIFFFMLTPDPENESDFDSDAEVLDEDTTYIAREYNIPGTYKYTLKEDPGDNPNYTYDETEYEITIVVKNESGNLTASWTATANGKAADKLVFKNVFHKPDSVTVLLPIEKKIEGAARTDREKEIFYFKLTPDPDNKNDFDSDAEVWDEDTAYIAREYNTSGTYSYTLSEVAGDDPNYTYDETNYKITIVVDENLNATWTATANGTPAKALVFTNVFERQDGVTVLLPVEKKVYGPARTDAQKEVFFFKLTPAPGNESDFESDAEILDEGATYIARYYNTPGEYTYTLTEDPGSNPDPNYTYDKTKYEITIVVDENLNATWTAAANGTPAKELVFTNVFHKPGGVTVLLPIEKKIEGPARTDAEKEVFFFNLTHDPDNEGDFDSDAEVLDEDTAYIARYYTTPGIYTYTLTEEPGDDPHYTYDGRAYNIVINVVQTDGKLTASWTANGEATDKLVFTNGFQRPNDVTLVLPVKKKVYGLPRASADKEIFHFLLMGMKNGSSIPGEVRDEGTAYFNMYFNEPGEYTYVLSELPGNNNTDYVYDETQYEITVMVEPDENGRLTASWTATVDGEPVEELVFENVFQHFEAADIVLPVKKKIYGPKRAQIEEEFFTFLMTDMENGLSDGDVVLGEGTSYFGKLRSKPGEYFFTLTEDPGDDPNPDYIYDKTRYAITVKFEPDEDEKGTLKASWTATADGSAVDKLVFGNIYQPSGSVTLVLPVEKKIYGPERTETEKKDFTFLLTGPDEGSSISKGVLDEGTIKFALNFDTPGEYTYTLKEMEGDDPNYTYDGTTYNIVVNVVRDETDGKLKASWTATADGKEAKQLVFENVFQRPGSVTLVLPVEKKIDGPARTEIEKRIFTFLLTDEDTKTSTSGFVIDEGTVKFDVFFADPGEYKYTLKEVEDNNAYYTCDTREYEIIVNVDKNEDDGTLTADWTAMCDGESADQLVFVNHFARPFPPLVFNLPVTKRVEGDSRAENEKETFFFEMTAVDQAPELVARRISIRDAGTAEYSFAFDAPGTYRYTLKEVTGSNSDYRYDRSEYAIRITVDDDMKNVHWSAQRNNSPAESIVFTNTYQKNPYTFEWTFTKRWSGGHEDGIEWAMYNEAGKRVRKGFNKRVVSPDEWKYSTWFDRPNDYYIIEEVPAGYVVMYRNVGAHADVTDRCYNGGTIINMVMPPTGDDDSPLSAYGIAGLLSLGCLLFLIRRRRRDRSAQ